MLDASPLDVETKARLMWDAQYMAARLRGDAAKPPSHWAPAQMAAFAAVLADPSARAAALAWVVEGWRQVNTAADALQDE